MCLSSCAENFSDHTMISRRNHVVWHIDRQQKTVGFVFVLTFFVRKVNVHLLSRVHSHALTFATRRHKYFRRRNRRFSVILIKLRFWYEKGPFWLLEGALSLSKRTLRNKRVSFRKNESDNWYHNSWTAWQHLRKKQGIFVIVCGISQGVDKKQMSKRKN